MKQRDPVAEGGCCIALSCMFPGRQINELKPGIQSSSRFSVVFGHSLIYSRFDHFSDCHGVPEYIWIELRLKKLGISQDGSGHQLSLYGAEGSDSSGVLMQV